MRSRLSVIFDSQSKNRTNIDKCQVYRFVCACVCFSFACVSVYFGFLYLLFASTNVAFSFHFMCLLIAYTDNNLFIIYILPNGMKHQERWVMRWRTKPVMRDHFTRQRSRNHFFWNYASIPSRWDAIRSRSAIPNEHFSRFHLTFTAKFSLFGRRRWHFKWRKTDLVVRPNRCRQKLLPNGPNGVHRLRICVVVVQEFNDHFNAETQHSLCALLTADCMYIITKNTYLSHRICTH